MFTFRILAKTKFMGSSFRLLLSSCLLFISLITFAQVDNPISADEARSLVKARYKDGFDIGEKIFTIDKYEFNSDAITMQTSCPVRFTRPITGQDWHVKQNFTDFLECIKPHLNRVYSVAYKYRYTDEEPFIEDNESIKLDGDIYSGKRREAELAIAIDMVMEVYSMAFPFLDGFGGIYDEKTDSDEYHILDDTLEVGNNVRRQWLIEELHKNPKRAGPICDGLIQIFEDNFVPIQRDYLTVVIDALTFVYEHPTEVDWEIYAGITVAGGVMIYFSRITVPSAVTIGRAALSRAFLSNLLTKSPALRNQFDKIIKITSRGKYSLNSEWKDWPKYMTEKGWTREDISRTLIQGKWLKHYKENYLNPGNPVSIVTDEKTGRSLIIDNRTREILQLGKDGYKY